MLQNPIGYLIQAQGMTAAQRTSFLTHVTFAHHTTHSVMDDYRLASDLATLHPETTVIHRWSNWEPRPDQDYLASFNALVASLGPVNKAVVLMVNCEQGFDHGRVNMWLNLCQRADTMGLRLAVGNVASGTVKCGQGSDPNDWTTVGAPLLRYLVNHPQHLLAFHEYTSFFPWLVSNGAWGDPASPPSVLDWTKPQWHLGRNPQGLMSACKILGLDFHKLRLVVTEGFLDTMNDVSSHYPGVNSYGWRNLVGWWNSQPGLRAKSAELTLADMAKWTWEKVYAPLGNVVGMHVYTYLNASGDPRWEPFRVDNAPAFLIQMEGYHPVVSSDDGTSEPPPPVTPPQPPPVQVPVSLVMTLQVDGLEPAQAQAIATAMQRAVWTTSIKAAK